MKTFYGIMTAVVVLVLAVIGFASAQGYAESPILVGDVSLESMQVVLEFAETQDEALLAIDAELYVAGQMQPIVGREAIADFLGVLYDGRGDILGASIEPLRLIPYGDNTVIFEYNYRGTTFLGDDYTRAGMLDDYVLNVPMISIYEVEDGKIAREFLFEYTTPSPLHLETIK